MKKLRAVCMFLVLVLSMLSLPSLASAAVSDVVFNEVEVNGIDVDLVGGTSVVNIERGDDVELRVELTSSVDTNLWLKASIDGYEYGEIRDSTGMFEVTAGVKTKYLHLELPDDMESGDYALNLWVTDGTGKQDAPLVTLEVGKARHNLEITDVMLRPTSTVEAGRPLAVEVRLENMGSVKEEDIKVTASLKDLGVSTRAYLDELGFEELTSDDDETSGEVTLYLPVPVDALSGEYELEVDVEFNRGHDVVSTKTMVYVDGTSEAKTGVNTIISLDAVSKSVVKGESVTYRLMLANLGDSETLYSLGVQGAESWADVVLSPGFVRVSPNNAGELTLTVTPRDVASVGDHSFTLKVRQGERTLRDVTLSTLVSEGESALRGVKSVLEIGFAVLVALLVILGLVVAFKKLGRRERSNEPEPIMDNGQSYY